MMTLNELWKHFKFLSDIEGFTREEQEFLMRFLTEEYALKEQKRRGHLLRMSGIKRVKLFTDFDWAFNPKIPREKIMEFMQTDYLRKLNQANYTFPVHVFPRFRGILDDLYQLQVV